MSESASIASREPESQPEPRRFTVADALLLIVAAAVGCALVREWLNPGWALYPMQLAFYPLQGQSLARRIHRAIALSGSWTIPFAIALTPALLVARLRRPRPSFERIAREPGSVACAAAFLAMMVRWCQEALDYLVDYLTYTSSPVHLPSPPFQRLWIAPRISVGQAIHNILLESFPFLVAPIVGGAVLAAWLVLLANRLWHKQADWVDRCGRILGAYWIALAVFTAVMSILWKHID